MGPDKDMYYFQTVEFFTGATHLHRTVQILLLDSSVDTSP